MVFQIEKVMELGVEMIVLKDFCPKYFYYQSIIVCEFFPIRHSFLWCNIACLHLSLMKAQVDDKSSPTTSNKFQINRQILS